MFNRKQTKKITSPPRATKSKSRYINDKELKTLYNNLPPHDVIILSILHFTGIRIGELEQYVSKAETTTYGEPIELIPEKKNNSRLIPNILTPTQLSTLSDISIKKSALQKRIAKWPVKMSPHDLRATFITKALDLDIAPAKIRNLTGHKSIDSVMKYDRLQSTGKLWMYDLINQAESSYSNTDDVQSLAKEVNRLTQENFKLKAKLRKANNV